MEDFLPVSGVWSDLEPKGKIMPGWLPYYHWARRFALWRKVKTVPLRLRRFSTRFFCWFGVSGGFSTSDPENWVLRGIGQFWAKCSWALYLRLFYGSLFLRNQTFEACGTQMGHWPMILENWPMSSTQFSTDQWSENWQMSSGTRLTNEPGTDQRPGNHKS